MSRIIIAVLLLGMLAGCAPEYGGGYYPTRSYYYHHAAPVHYYSHRGRR